MHAYTRITNNYTLKYTDTSLYEYDRFLLNWFLTESSLLLCRKGIVTQYVDTGINHAHRGDRLRVINSVSTHHQKGTLLVFWIIKHIVRDIGLASNTPRAGKAPIHTR